LQPERARAETRVSVNKRIIFSNSQLPGFCQSGQGGSNEKRPGKIARNKKGGQWPPFRNFDQTDQRE
jgi:hypothetical protein